MNILILSHALHQNYGCLLQAYALQKVCKDLGHNAVTDRDGSTERSMKSLLKRKFIHTPRFIWLKKILARLFPANTRGLLYALQKKNTSKFTQKYIKAVDFFGSASLSLHQYDAIIVGSDQVWRSAFFDVRPYYLDFAKEQKIKKIAYAASFGVDYWDEYSTKLTEECKDLAQRFTAISVRESSGVSLCRDHLNVEALHVLDPTLLLEKDEYISLIDEYDLQDKSPSIMAYLLDETEEKSQFLARVEQSLNLPSVMVKPNEILDSHIKKYDNCIFPDVSKWLKGYNKAKFVVTDSFHGTVFAIIFNIPFFVIVNSSRGAARFESLLKIFNLENRIIESIDDIEERLHVAIDFDHVNKIKKQWQEKSIEFLMLNLSSK